jgi:hypothetical protein
VLKEPVSYSLRIYQPGETVEATEEEMAGLLQAGYVTEVEARKRRQLKAISSSL